MMNKTPLWKKEMFLNQLNQRMQMLSGRFRRLKKKQEKYPQQISRDESYFIAAYEKTIKDRDELKKEILSERKTYVNR